MELANLAATLKAQYNLPYADGFVGALAHVTRTLKSAPGELKFSAL
jgi:hypothetical protein